MAGRYILPIMNVAEVIEKPKQRAQDALVVAEGYIDGHETII